MPVQHFLTTHRLQISYHAAGSPGKPRLMLVHGNASSSKFFLPLMARLAPDFELVAPDLRCFGQSQPLPVDAARGLRDFSDDLDAFASALGWDRFFLLGWSMGGGVAMQYAMDHSQKLLGLILEAPLSPYGFGGTAGPQGTPLQPPGLASGGGCANAQLVQALEQGNRDFLRSVLNSIYFAPPYQAPPQWEEVYLDAIASTRVGEGMYPGDYVPAAQWPGVAAGSRGICNTMSPVFCDLSPLADIPERCPILWIRGSQDLMVSDQSMCDFGALGAMGLVPGWPGAEAFPPQPMLEQTRFVLERYAANGGQYREVVLEGGGHACHIDREDQFLQALTDFLHAPSQTQ